MEQWKPVVGFDGYQVSDLGNVIGPRGRVLKRVPHTGNYACVNLYRVPQQGEKRLIHRLVLEAFVGPCPPGHEGAHGNGERQDCKLTNLAWKTTLENNHDKIKHGTVCKGEAHGQSVLKEEQVLLIRAATGLYRDIGKQFGVSPSAVGQIKRKERWGHIS